MTQYNFITWKAPSAVLLQMTKFLGNWTSV